MPLVLDVTLPFGRYAATPWGHHVNEGMVEWPPAPWRIARALVASWHIHHPSLAREDVTRSLSTLCTAPHYSLPDHDVASTRHYLPTSDLPTKSKRRPGNPSTSMGLQPFIVTPPESVVTAAWDNEVDDEQLGLLQRLASTVSYLGRAESRAELAFSRRAVQAPLAPLDSGDLHTGEVLDVLVPTKPLDLAVLEISSKDLHDERRTVPPGTRWATYPVPEASGQADAVVRRPDAPAITVLQYAITSPAPPTMDNTALLAARFRQAVTSRADDDPDLHGHRDNDASKPRQDDHQHAHYLVLNDEGSSRASRLLLWTPAGIDSDAVARLADMDRLRIPEHLHKRLGDSLQIHLTNAGQTTQLDPRIRATGRRWISLTPVTTVRHRKRKQSVVAFVDDVVRRELGHRGLPNTEGEVTVTVVRDDEYPEALKARRMYRSRTLGRRRKQPGFHVRLEFASPATGPLLLGSLAHFGLGLFVLAD